MTDQKMWREWIHLKMELVSRRQIPTELAEVSYILERKELTKILLAVARGAISGQRFKREKRSNLVDKEVT